MNWYPGLESRLEQAGLLPELKPVLDSLPEYFSISHHGENADFAQVIAGLPEVIASDFSLDSDTVRIGAPGDIDNGARENMKALLRKLHPWRKGPYEIFGVQVDTEWRSDWKWKRLAPHISPLKDRVVLDVGCANGYYGWRMAGKGAKLVLGIDPSTRYVFQYLAIKKYLPDPPVYVLPLSIDDMPVNTRSFDTVFSMGVLYHRRAPLDHLTDLFGQLRPGGELVLETLVIEGGEGDVLAPPGRYAKMRNVWFIPSVDTLLAWLKKSGYRDSRIVDVSLTSLEEQRSTEWMTFESLENFLDPEDRNKTIEGWPAPRRAILIANKE